MLTDKTSRKDIEISESFVPSQQLQDTQQQYLHMNYQFELFRTQDFVIFGQAKKSSKSLYALNLVIYNLVNSQLDEFKLNFIPADGWEVEDGEPDQNYLLPQGETPTNQTIFLNCNNDSLFQLNIIATYKLDSEPITEKGEITKLPPPILYAELFRTWASRTNFKSIIDKHSQDSPVYQKLNPKFNSILQNTVTIKTLIDFLLLELEDKTENKSYRECVLYLIVTSVTNSQYETQNSKAISKWIQNIDNLASLFGFSYDHCYLFSLIYSLELEKATNQNLFSYNENADSKNQSKQKDEKSLSQEIFSHIIQDQELLPSDSQIDENKNELIYYLMSLLVELNYYEHAYRFYNAFIDENVENCDIQIDIIKTLTVETSLVTAFNFFRKSLVKSDMRFEEKLQAMIKMVFQVDKVNEFLHLPFNPKEKQIIFENCQKIIEIKFNQNGTTDLIDPPFIKNTKKQNQEKENEEEEEEEEAEEEEEEEEAKTEEDMNELNQIKPILEKYHIMIQIVNRENKYYKSIKLPFNPDEKTIIMDILKKYNYSFFQIIYLDL